MEHVAGGASERIVRVGLRWLPWRPRPRKIDLDVTDGIGLPVDIDSPIALIVVLVVVAFFAIGGVGIVFLPFELTAVLLVAVALLALRVIGFMPWEVVIVTADKGAMTEQVRGTFAARRRVAELRSSIRW
jgi:hypothetical protein